MTSQLPKYVRVSQSLPIESTPRTYENFKAVANDLFLPEIVERYFHESDALPIALWGSGVFKVQEDGTLKLLSSNWDSSD
jgi:hypothetical protein